MDEVAMFVRHERLMTEHYALSENDMFITINKDKFYQNIFLFVRLIFYC